MRLPEALLKAIEHELEVCPLEELRRASEQLSLHYRAEKNSQALFQSRASRLAYLAVRMPATYAAILSVFRECRLRLPDWQPRSFLDIGAGPGTGGWAAIECFPSLQSLCFIEPNQPMREIGARLTAPLHAEWATKAPPTSDLALLSYIIGEIKPTDRQDLFEHLWLTAQLIIVIEPGTPAGYRRIMDVRDWALSRDANIVAPCPHREPCPMLNFKWCHFPARVERTRIHKLLKGGTLGYEDEKFSYLIFGKVPSQKISARIVGSPQKASGFVRLPLCIDGKLKEVVVSRKQNEYRSARDKCDGDSWM